MKIGIRIEHNIFVWVTIQLNSLFDQNFGFKMSMILLRFESHERAKIHLPIKKNAIRLFRTKLDYEIEMTIY